ncbi:M23 family metallopeptidase [Halobacteriovorax sp. HFRX-2_2]|uniref:M23 family metallopeptidase n=1 Tax=unclassified Halobacteriovorax TaxID=2639665 RepID=UPI0037107D2D
MKKSLLFLATLLTILSCTTLKNGRYIKLTDNYNAEKLADIFNIPQWQIEEFNKGAAFKKGDTIFLPYKNGILYNRVEGRTISSINYQKLRKSSRFLWPVPSSNRVTSGYGHRWGRPHEGIDIAARKGTYIVSADAGVVVFSGRKSGYGNITVVSHVGGFFTIYAHNHKNYTRKGQKVARGQVIAAVGNTGKSTGDHLHFEIRHDSKAFDPLEFFHKH